MVVVGGAAVPKNVPPSILVIRDRSQRIAIAVNQANAIVMLVAYDGHAL